MILLREMPSSFQDSPMASLLIQNKRQSPANSLRHLTLYLSELISHPRLISKESLNHSTCVNDL